AAVETGKRLISADDNAMVRSSAPPAAIQAVKLIFYFRATQCPVLLEDGRGQDGCRWMPRSSTAVSSSAWTRLRCSERAAFSSFIRKASADSGDNLVSLSTPQWHSIT